MRCENVVSLSGFIKIRKRGVKEGTVTIIKLDYIFTIQINYYVQSINIFSPKFHKINHIWSGDHHTFKKFTESNYQIKLINPKYERRIPAKELHTNILKM